MVWCAALAGALSRLSNALLAIQFGCTPTKDAFGFGSKLYLEQHRVRVNPLAEPVTFQVGSFATTIPIGSFIAQGRVNRLKGVIDGVSLEALIKPTGSWFSPSRKPDRPHPAGTKNSM